MEILRNVILLILLTMPSAWAHDHREVAGKFIFVVGFVNEPAFAGAINGVDLRVSTIKGEKPIEGLEETLQVTVFKKGQDKSIDLPLRPRYKEPGRYAAYFLPTQPGVYIFEFKGTIYGLPINEQFESSKDKFHDIEDPVRFP